MKNLKYSNGSATYVESLEKKIAELEKQIVAIDMNNEPVAWLVQYKDRHEFRWGKPEHLFEALACEPLYTHPVKELTDEDWGDRKDQWTDAIQAEHPLNTKDYKTYEMAMEMVGNRHGKFALVALVNWLLRKAQK